MIVYDLRCELNHHFEGWFRCREDYQKQRNQHMIACPRCASIQIEKCPSAPNVIQKIGDEGTNTKADLERLYEAAEQYYQHLIETTEDVGTSFPDEVRKIHYQEAPYRRVRGLATTDEAKELSEEGIELIPIPTTDPCKSDTH